METFISADLKANLPEKDVEGDLLGDALLTKFLKREVGSGVALKKLFSETERPESLGGELKDGGGDIAKARERAAPAADALALRKSASDDDDVILPEEKLADGKVIARRRIGGKTYFWKCDVDGQTVLETGVES